MSDRLFLLQCPVALVMGPQKCDTPWSYSHIGVPGVTPFHLILCGVLLKCGYV